MGSTADSSLKGKNIIIHSKNLGNRRLCAHFYHILGFQQEIPMAETIGISTFGRGRRLRTLGLRFWRPPLYQLSYSPICTLKWWTVRDSNPGPTGYEPVALPTELTVQISLKKLPSRYRDGNTVSVAPPVGFEPTTLRLTAACSTC